MLLTGTDGPNRLQIRVTGYQFPDALDLVALYADRNRVWTGSYDHSELGGYIFHGIYGLPSDDASRGEYTCGHQHHCWIYSFSAILLEAWQYNAVTTDGGTVDYWGTDVYWA